MSHASPEPVTPRVSPLPTLEDFTHEVARLTAAVSKASALTERSIKEIDTLDSDLLAARKEIGTVAEAVFVQAGRLGGLEKSTSEIHRTVQKIQADLSGFQSATVKSQAQILTDLAQILRRLQASGERDSKATEIVFDLVQDERQAAKESRARTWQIVSRVAIPVATALGTLLAMKLSGC